MEDRHMFSELYKFVSQLRSILNSHIYINQNNILGLIEIIRSSIDPVSVEYDANTNSIFVKIKKTAMKKIKEFDNKPEFYYSNLVVQIFSLFIRAHYGDLIAILNKDTLDAALNNPLVLLNICHITCLSDNVFTIQL